VIPVLPVVSPSLPNTDLKSDLELTSRASLPSNSTQFFRQMSKFDPAFTIEGMERVLRARSPIYARAALRVHDRIWIARQSQAVSG